LANSRGTLAAVPPDDLGIRLDLVVATSDAIEHLGLLQEACRDHGLHRRISRRGMRAVQLVVARERSVILTGDRKALSLLEQVDGRYGAVFIAGGRAHEPP
jgi:hypothetical protein